MMPQQTGTRPDTAPARAATVLELRDVHKAYGVRDAVRGVDFEVADGEFLTLLGPSGSGKSTIINLVAGFLEPTSGDIRYEGESVTRIPAHRRNIGVVFQNYALFPHLTAAENIGFPLKMRGLSGRKGRDRISAALDLVDLGAEGDKYPKELSGGQQQRVALARALVFEPKLLLMDEPLSSLDKRMRERLQQDIVRVQQALGIAVVYVTHDQDEAFLMSDRIGVVNHGRIIQLGTGEELFDRPKTVFVANFIGDSNLIRGRLDRAAAELVVAGTGQRLPVATDAAGRLPSAAATDVVLMVRPGRITLSSRDTAPSRAGHCRLDGVLVSATYVSGTMRYRVEVPALGGHLACVMDGGQATERLVPGDPVTATWSGGDAVLVEDDRDPDSELSPEITGESTTGRQETAR
jgi:putative spermidine/putrescine transport system ATP-binding protein